MSREHIVKKACNECPFSRQCVPGALGNSPPEVYVGQAQGPFWLPCHLDTDFADANWKKDFTKAQCAGAAIYRSNLGIDMHMPQFLHRLPADTETVFASPAELIAHHRGISLEEATQILKERPPGKLLEEEFAKVTPEMQRPALKKGSTFLCKITVGKVDASGQPRLTCVPLDPGMDLDKEKIPYVRGTISIRGDDLKIAEEDRFRATHLLGAYMPIFAKLEVI